MIARVALSAWLIALSLTATSILARANASPQLGPPPPVNVSRNDTILSLAERPIPAPPTPVPPTPSSSSGSGNGPSSTNNQTNQPVAPAPAPVPTLPNVPYPSTIQIPTPGSTSWNDAICGITGLDINIWIAIGDKAWTFLQQNRPALNGDSTAVKTISILPQSVSNFTDMANWSAPIVKTYSLSYKDGSNMDVVSFTYQIVYNYGGSYRGKGHYLAGLHVIPKGIKALPGYSASAIFEASEALNVATTADPVVGLSFEVKLTVKGTLKEEESTQDFLVTGNGDISEL